MKVRLLIGRIAVAAVAIHASVGSLLARTQPAAAVGPWQPVPGQIMTRWAQDVSPGKVLPEYPRPQMVRQQWQNLNGLWDYAITDAVKTGTDNELVVSVFDATGGMQPKGKRYLYVAGCKSVELSPDGLRSIGQVGISGTNHNERGAWAAVRPAVFASGAGQARFASFIYRPL